MFHGAVTDVFVTEDVSLITLANVPLSSDVAAKIFTAIAEGGIIIDMINQTPPYQDTVNISFTISDKDLKNTLKILGGLQKEFPGIRTDINTANGKITVYGEEMKNVSGVAAAAFRVLANANVNIKMITTSEIDISFLVSRDDLEKAKETFLAKNLNERTV